MKTTTLATLALVAIAATAATVSANPIIPHMDSQAAKAQMIRKPQPAIEPKQPQPSPPQPKPTPPPNPPPSVLNKLQELMTAHANPTPTTPQERLAAFEAYREQLRRNLEAARERELHARYPHAGPWEMIADLEYDTRVGGGEQKPPITELTPAPKPMPPHPVQPLPVPPQTMRQPPTPPPAPAASSTTPAPASPPVIATVPVSQTTPVPTPTPLPQVPSSPVVVPAAASSDADKPKPAEPPTTPPPPPPPHHPTFRERLASLADRLRAIRDRWFKSHPRPEEQAHIPTSAPEAPKLANIPPATPRWLQPKQQPQQQPHIVQKEDGSVVELSPSGKPYLNRDQVLHGINRFNGIIAANQAKRQQKRRDDIALATRAFAEANPPHPPGSPPATAHPPASWAMGQTAPPLIPQRGCHHHSKSVQKNPNDPVRFVLQFQGRCETKPNGTDANGKPGREVPVCRLRATSQDIETKIHPRSGVEMEVTRLIGAQAHLTVFNVNILSESAFTASGNMSFGSTRHKPHSLGFATAGPARVYKLKDGERSFSAQFQVHAGESEFEGAEGAITMNGRFLSLDRVEALVTGVVFKRPALEARRKRVLERIRKINAANAAAVHRTPIPVDAFDPNRDGPVEAADRDADETSDSEVPEFKSVVIGAHKLKPKVVQPIGSRTIHLQP